MRRAEPPPEREPTEAEVSTVSAPVQSTSPGQMWRFGLISARSADQSFRRAEETGSVYPPAGQLGVVRGGKAAESCWREASLARLDLEQQFTAGGLQPLDAPPLRLLSQVRRRSRRPFEELAEPAYRLAPAGRIQPEAL